MNVPFEKERKKQNILSEMKFQVCVLCLILHFIQSDDNNYCVYPINLTAAII